jgi:putative Mg2+ transporter-C (MgtC) family protein
MTHVDMLVRIAAGAALGGVIGYERGLRHHPAGLRTHLLVAMTAATFMVVSTRFVFFQNYGKADLVAVDTSRIAASVVSGIGFLAGGAILRSGLTIQGLTTAASLWLVTAIGMCAGGGMFVEAAGVTAMGIVALTLLRRVEDRKNTSLRRQMLVTLDGDESVALVSSALADVGVTVQAIDYEGELKDKRSVISLTMDVRIPRRLGATEVIAAVAAIPGVQSLRLQKIP